MKGSVFVGFYSVILIGLFIGCCYLMSIVNPKPLPEELKKLEPVEIVFARQPLPPIKKPNYGLEKIPEGIDADEFRRTTVTKYNFNLEPNFYERAQKVVPPVWPNEYKKIIESTIKADNKPNIKAFYEPSSPVKGHRRSVNDNTSQRQNDNSGMVLLKIIDDNGKKKIEIKFTSREKNQKKKLRKNRSSNKLNETFDSFLNSDQSNKLNFTGEEGDAIKINANDVILTIHDVSDVVLDESIIYSTESTKAKQNMAMDIRYTELCLNKTLNNDTKKIDARETAREPAEELMGKEIYTLNLVSNSSGITVDDISTN